MLLLLVWPQVLLAHPPPLYLSISTLPEDWVHRWLPALPLRALCVEQGLDPVRRAYRGSAGWRHLCSPSRGAGAARDLQPSPSCSAGAVPMRTKRRVTRLRRSRAAAGLRPACPTPSARCSWLPAWRAPACLGRTGRQPLGRACRWGNLLTSVGCGGSPGSTAALLNATKRPLIQAHPCRRCCTCRRR